MTDITHQDRRAARAWAKNWQGDQDDDTSAAARYILATVPAPATTLSERLQYRADLLDNGDPDGDTPRALRDLATNAAQMEHDLAEAIAEVEHLTAVQKGAESTAETPNPADVKPGEAWEVIATDPAKSFGGTTSYNTVAFRMTDRWIVCRQGYQTPLVVPDDYIRLVRRHVPAPRVITNPEELDQVKRRTVIRDAAGVVCERDAMGDYWTTFTSLANQKPHIEFPATVLWEPGA